MGLFCLTVGLALIVVAIATAALLVWGEVADEGDEDDGE